MFNIRSCSLQQIPISNCKKNSFQLRKLESQAPSNANCHNPPPLIFVWGNTDIYQSAHI